MRNVSRNAPAVNAEGQIVPARTDLKTRKAEILAALDLAAEYAALGVEFTSSKEDARGWRACRAFGREDRDPSAGVNMETGVYNSFGEGAETLGFFDFVVKYGKHGDFGQVLSHYEAKAGLATAPRPRKKVDRPRQVFATFEKAVEWVAALPTVQGKPEGSWTYSRQDGSQAFRVVRFATPSGKTYRPIHHDPSLSGWVCSDPDGPLPLYEVDLIAANLDATVWLGEGEKVADAACGLGLIGTTTAHGASSAHKSDLSPLAGRQVVLIPDHDAPGEAYANEVGSLLSKLTPPPTVRILRLPGLGPGEDLVEWLERVPDAWDDVSTRAELERLAADAPEWTPSAEIGPKPSKNGKHHDPTDQELGLIDLETVQSRPVDWLWHRRIALGKITLIAGEMGIGKSFLTLSMASIISRGAVWPDRPTEGVEPGHVILFSAEEDLEDTVKPRLEAMGANVKRISPVGTGVNPNGTRAPFTIGDIERLEAIVRKRPETRLIIIDPVTAYLGSVDDHKNADLRALLDPLAEFAKRAKVAIVALTHFNKGAGRTVLSRIIGSIAYTATARSVFCVALDPENEDRRLLMPVKSNLDTEKTSLAYTIIDGAVVWEDDTLILNPNKILNGGEPSAKESRRTKAVAWLKETLATGEMSSDDVIERARAAGFGKNLIWEVKEEAGVRARKNSFKGEWFWAVDAPATPF